MVGGRLKREEIYVYLRLIHAEEQNYVKQSSFNKNDLKKKKEEEEEARARTRHRAMDSFKIGKGVCPVYCHPAYLTYMQSTTCEILAG